MRPEAGQLTVALAGNAQGAIIPLFFVFPPKRFKEHFLKGGPVGFAGTGNPSGWMKEEDFVLFLAHFVRHTQSCKSCKFRFVCEFEEGKRS